MSKCKPEHGRSARTDPIRTEVLFDFAQSYISRVHASRDAAHAETTRAKDETIEVLREQVAWLRSRLHQCGGACAAASAGPSVHAESNHTTTL